MSKINLHGKWNFQLDVDKTGINSELFKKELNDTIILPTTTSEAKKGEVNIAREVSFLTDLYKFEGFAWFSKEIEFIENYSDNYIELVMERTRVTHLWVDDKYVGTYNSLCTSHHYDITSYISKNKHKITIMVDNTSYPTKGGHMTSPDTQTNWNGITGEISINITNKTRLYNVKFYPNTKDKTVTVKGNILGDKIDKISLIAFDYNKSFEKQSYNINNNSFEVKYFMSDDVELWSEYNPHTYKMEIRIEKDKEIINEDIYSFGMLSFKTNEKKFLINGKETFLRGKHDGLIFPLTGYAPTDIESWIKILKTSKEYGINHYRFHTCCPPKAAFEAADMLGIYMEPELPFWGTITTEDDENHDSAMQDYLIEEGYRMLDEFGNHPSFVMMSLGNELWGSKETLNSILKGYKEYDNRHLYVQGCNNFQWAPCILEEDDFFSGVRFSGDRLYRGSYAMCDAPQGHIQTDAPNTNHNYDEIIRPSTKEKCSVAEVGVKQIQYGTGVKEVIVSETEEFVPNVPVISHEIGQYETFPNFKEMKNDIIIRAELLSDSEAVWSKEIQVNKLHIGVNYLDSLSFELPDCEIPEKYIFKLSSSTLNISNHYDLWVYPIVPEIDNKDIFIANNLDELLRGISNNKNILYYPDEDENLNSIEGTYCTDFWCYPMFRSISESMGKPTPIGTMGLLINEKHPALKNFPCEFYSTPQWWEIVMKSHLSILDDVKIDPIVQMIDNFERNHLLGLIYEFKVNKSNILVCTSPLKDIKDSREAQWLQYSLIKYIKSDSFKPEKTIDIERVIKKRM